MAPRRAASVKENPPLAFSYLRFSSPEQGRGDSLRRQVELREAWLARTGAVLDTSVSLRDEGVSAFSGKHRENPDRHALASFLELVKRGRIPRGSFLIVESLDRLSREHIRPALTLLLNLIESGVRVVQLLPVEAIYDEAVDPMALMVAIMELSRGHSESMMKSERLGRAWQEKKRVAATSKRPLTSRAPAWLSVVDGAFVVDEGKAQAIRLVFRLATEGNGLSAIARKLNREKVPVVGKGAYWARSYVEKLLTSRAILGEYQPHTRRGGHRRPDGDAIADYFPRIISDEEWHAARGAMLSRKGKGGRPSVRINLFAGVLKDAVSGGALHMLNKGKKGSGPILSSYMAINGVEGAKQASFPMEVFEEAILTQLREIDPAELLDDQGDQGGKVLSLTSQLATVEARVEQIQAELVEDGDVKALVAVLRKLEEKRDAIAGDLAQAQREAASPAAVAWGEAASLFEAISSAPDPQEVKIRLRGAIRRICEGVWCVFVGKGATRLAAVQMFFAGGQHRSWLIVHRPARGGFLPSQPRQWSCMSLAQATSGKELDLRRPEHAQRLEKALQALDPT